MMKARGGGPGCLDRLAAENWQMLEENIDERYWWNGKK